MLSKHFPSCFVYYILSILIHFHNVQIGESYLVSNSDNYFILQNQYYIARDCFITDHFDIHKKQMQGATQQSSLQLFCCCVKRSRILSPLIALKVEIRTSDRCMRKAVLYLVPGGKEIICY